jgi:hypothetical protein
MGVRANIKSTSQPRFLTARISNPNVCLLHFLTSYFSKSYLGYIYFKQITRICSKNTYPDIKGKRTALCSWIQAKLNTLFLRSNLRANLRLLSHRLRTGQPGFDSRQQQDISFCQNVQTVSGFKSEFPPRCYNARRGKWFSYTFFIHFEISYAVCWLMWETSMKEVRIGAYIPSVTGRDFM